MTSASPLSDYDYLIKICVVGDSQVGKSCLIQRYTNDIFPETLAATIGVDFFFHNVEVDGKRVKIQVWDTAGQERFQSISQSYYRGAHAVLYVYDMADAESAANLEQWHDRVTRVAKDDITCSVMGNKSDLKHKSEAITAAKDFATKHGLQHDTVSAKTAVNVERAFMELAESCLKVALAREAKHPKSSPGRPLMAPLLSNTSRSASWLSMCTIL
eukprot:TRINITY_DN9263_c0_g1_i3.p1 TRINITY_DN9263_c0_g1~~TRINITY_DN9263_c0_g1_i3.p1  ORF type:complete len:242 (+),score=38.46 TRINITY_DN9263_c0_g1_i3:83-727(+)